MSRANSRVAARNKRPAPDEPVADDVPAAAPKSKRQRGEDKKAAKPQQREPEPGPGGDSPESPLGDDSLGQSPWDFGQDGESDSGADRMVDPMDRVESKEPRHSVEPEAALVAQAHPSLQQTVTAFEALVQGVRADFQELRGLVLGMQVILV